MRFDQIITDFPQIWYLQLTYWKYSFGVVPEWGICTPFLSPTVGHLQLFQNKVTNTQQMPGGEGGMELTEPLIKNVILPGKLSILCDI